MKRKSPFTVNRYAVLLITCLVFFNFHPSYGQADPIEFGINISPSTYLGDLGGNGKQGSSFLQNNNLSMTRLIAGAYVAIHPKKWLGIRMAFNKGSLAGDDAAIKGKGGIEEGRRSRNLHFKSKITEGLIAAEIYPTVFLESDDSDRFHKIRPYFLVGAGIYHYNPQGKDPVNGGWTDLRSLHTEGQGFAEYPDRKNYRLTQLNIPVGGGLKYFVDDNVSISLEILYRKLFTDYIDDVSTNYIDNDLFYAYMPVEQAQLAERMSDQSLGISNRRAGDIRGGALKKDAFYTAGFKLGIRLGSHLGDSDSPLKCPVDIY